MCSRSRWVVRDDGCWEWTGPYNVHGYGMARSGATRHNAHRAVWTELVGPIADGLVLDHLCRNRECVNPAHMEPVTVAENNRRMQAARDSCRHGHPLDGVRRSRGHTCRYCLTCHRERETRKREARRVLTA